MGRHVAARLLLAAALSCSRGDRRGVVEAAENCGSLRCRNGGECTVGTPLYGFSEQLVEETFVDTQLILQRGGGGSGDSSGGEVSVDFGGAGGLNGTAGRQAQYCKCPQYYGGLECEIEVRPCPATGHCSNGSPCRESLNDAGRAFFHCECDAAASDLTATYASRFCQHISTVYCHRKKSGNNSSSSNNRTDNFNGTGDEAKKLSNEVHKVSFCANGGTCRETDDPQQTAHKSCNCPKLWDGPHCVMQARPHSRRNSTFFNHETEESSGTNNDNSGGGSGVGLPTIIIAVTIALVVVIVLGTAFVVLFILDPDVPPNGGGKDGIMLGFDSDSHDNDGRQLDESIILEMTPIMGEDVDDIVSGKRRAGALRVGVVGIGGARERREIKTSKYADLEPQVKAQIV